MLTESESFSEIIDSTNELVELKNMLRAAGPLLVREKAYDELGTLLDMYLSAVECHCENLQMALNDFAYHLARKLT